MTLVSYEGKLLRAPTGELASSCECCGDAPSCCISLSARGVPTIQGSGHCSQYKERVWSNISPPRGCGTYPVYLTLTGSADDDVLINFNDPSQPDAWVTVGGYGTWAWINGCNGAHGFGDGYTFAISRPFDIAAADNHGATWSIDVQLCFSQTLPAP